MADSAAAKKLQALSEELTGLQQELQTSVTSRQKLEAQKTENEGVRKELANMKDGEAVYKMVGPVLLKQDRIEAESTVDGRLEFIGKDIDRLDQLIEQLKDKLEQMKTEIVATQTGAQAGAPAVAAK